ncbi:MAG: thioredoxin family protein [Deltaproteobacteria bacterium]|nr:thioredoxin family protein [Deltaproteobacteria bacterium]
MLDTNLTHINTTDEFQEVTSQNENVMVCCGRMGPMCLPVYDVMENLEGKCSDVKFLDMDFDSSVAMDTIRRLPEVRGFNGLPFTVYFKKGKVARATSSIQSKKDVTSILDSEFGLSCGSGQADAR